jgi:hypothetical protein
MKELSRTPNLNWTVTVLTDSTTPVMRAADSSKFLLYDDKLRPASTLQEETAATVLNRNHGTLLALSLRA